ncbi:hypothetical protein CAP35_07345, partial [Chitinophagaceae bacterium IBVUCB1]
MIRIQHLAKLLMLLCCLFSATNTQAQVLYSEGTDLPSVLSPQTLSTISAAGTYTVSGVTTTPGDAQDAFNIVVGTGFQITSVSRTVASSSPAYNGYTSFNFVDISNAGTSTFGLSYPLAAGTYLAFIASNFAVGNNWSFTITVTATASAPTITTNPSNRSICAGNNTSFTVAANNSPTSYQWQVNTGGGYSNLSNGGVYSNVTAATMNITGATAGMNGFLYRATATNGSGTSSPSSGATLTVGVVPTPTFTTSPGANTCANTNVTYTTQSGQNAYNWVVPGTAGVDYTIISGGIGSSSNTVTLQWLTAGTKNVFVDYQNISGCWSAVSGSSSTTVGLVSLTSLSQTNVSCNGGSNGAASVNSATGGSSPYTYNWTPGNPTGDGTVSVTGLTAGSWTCTVTDNNGCTAARTFTITQPTAISLTAASQTNISCNGFNNGAASVNVATGGAGGYTYNWTPGNPTGDGTTSVTGLSAQVWTCTVTDANSCTATQTFNITQPTALSLTAASQTNVACFGGSNGAASVNTPTGGTGGYTYNWTPGNPTGDGTTSVTGLTVGSWTCTVSDANSCTATQLFNITSPSPMSLTAASQTNVSCNGGANGAASVNVATGGAGGYTYNWTPGNPTGDGTTSVTGLTAGTWTCTVTDANSCTATRTFTITQPTAIVVTAASQTNISCNGGSNGAASINTPTGGAGGYTYNWTPGNPTGDGTTSVTGLTAGSWTCTVTDANSCTASQTFNITQPTALTAGTSQTNVSCNGGSNGTTTVSPSGGAGGYTYSWAPTGGSGATATGLAAGTYTCTITDANTCQITRTFTITQPTALSVTAASQTNVSCNGGSTGAASVNTPTGGAGGYTYNWTPGNPTGDGTVSVTGLIAGTWTCTVTDANSCTTTQTFNITQPTAIVVTAASQTNVSCNGGSNGAASINTPTGGAGGYTYNWTPGNPTGDGTVSVTGLTAGTWTCTVTDANSCTATQTFNITQPTAIVVTSASQTNVSCNGGSNGAASINTPTGGAGGFTYNWTPGNPAGDGTTSVTGLTAGTWTCTVTDANSCTASQTFNITQPTTLSVTAASQTNVSCNGGANGAASVNTPTGGAGGYTYNWTPGNPTGDGTVSVTGLTAGTWTCTVTDANSCTATQTFTITQPTALLLTAASQTNVACNGGSTGAASVNTPTGGAGGYTYNWTPGNPTGDGTVSVTGLTAGTWTCTVTDANSCTATQTFNITQPTAIVVTAASQTNVSCNGGSNGAASINTPTGGAGGYTYNWTPGNPTGDGTVSVTGLIAGTWTCTVTDANSCTATQIFTITQPASFTPTFTATPLANICAGTNQTYTTQAGQTNYVWNVPGTLGVDYTITAGGTGPTSNTVTLQWLTTGSKMVTVNYNNALGCSSTGAVSNSTSVNDIPTITSSPGNSTICSGTNTSFTIAASNSPTGYQWQESTNGGGAWANLSNGGVYSNVTSATMNITGATVSMSTYQYRAFATNSCGSSSASSAAVLTVNSLPNITTQPNNTMMSACALAGTATCTVAATGTAIAYQWQENQGSGWNNISTGGVYTTSSGMLFISNPPATMNGYQYRAIVSGACTPAVTSNITTLTVNTSPVVNTPPADVTICAGNNTGFTIVASGTALTYQWQENQGSGWSNLSNTGVYSNVTSANLSITAPPYSMNGYQYRCVVSGTCAPTATSGTATLTVNSSAIINTQPSNSSVCQGINAVFSVVAIGTNLTYRWYENQGSGFFPLSNSSQYNGVFTPTLTLTTAHPGLNGYQYQCRITTGSSCTPTVVTSNNATLTALTPPLAMGIASSTIVCAGSNTSISVSASGSGLTYQWQENAGSGYVNLSNTGVYSNVTTAAMGITGALASMNGYQYRCVVSGTCSPSVTTNASLLTVHTLPSVGTQPANVTTCAGSNITFSVGVSGTLPTYQWQEFNGISW